MTIEEAIFCEKSYLGETNCINCKYYATDTCESRESHKMAIAALKAALKAESCEDMMSAVMHILTELGYGDEENGADAEYMSALCDIAEKVKALQPVTPKLTECEDCVSRQAAKKLHCDICMDNNICYKNKENCEELDLFDKLPPITPKHRWIPVDYDRYPETYPKAFQEVWITDAYGEVIHRAYDGTRNIKAWMPYILPEPYKGGASE